MSAILAMQQETQRQTAERASSARLSPQQTSPPLQQVQASQPSNQSSSLPTSAAFQPGRRSSLPNMTNARLASWAQSDSQQSGVSSSARRFSENYPTSFTPAVQPQQPAPGAPTQASFSFGLTPGMSPTATTPPDNIVN